MKTKMLLIVALLLVSAAAYADEVPQIIIDGMNTYKTSGFNDAFNIWLKDSPMESDKTTIVNLKGHFTQIETMLGKMTGYYILRTIKISASSIRIYTEVLYEKGPLFMFFDCYKSAGAWIIPTMRFESDAGKILPDDIFKMK